MSQPGNGGYGNAPAHSNAGGQGSPGGADGYTSASERYNQIYAEQMGEYGNVPIIGTPLAAAQAQMRAQGMNEKQIEKLSQDAEFIEGLQGSDQNYPGQDHQAMYNYVHQGLDSGQTTQLSDAWAELVSVFDEFDGDFNDAVQKSHHHWEGESADSARSYMQSLGQWSKGNSQQAQLAS